MRRHRLAALAALVLVVAGTVLAAVTAVLQFPRGLVVLGCVVLACGIGWYGVLRRGLVRVAGLAAGVG